MLGSPWLCRLDKERIGAYWGKRRELWLGLVRVACSQPSRRGLLR